LYETNYFYFNGNGTNKRDEKLSEDLLYILMRLSFRQIFITKRGFVELLSMLIPGLSVFCEQLKKQELFYEDNSDDKTRTNS